MKGLRVLGRRPLLDKRRRNSLPGSCSTEFARMWSWVLLSWLAAAGATRMLECQQHPTPVDVTEYTFISSPRFPEGLPFSNETAACRLEFFSSVGNKTQIVLFNADLYAFVLVDEFNETDYTFPNGWPSAESFVASGHAHFSVPLVSASGGFWHAFQGYLLPMYADGCQYPHFSEPMIDLRHFVYLSGPSDGRAVECEQTFRTTSRFGFKIHIIEMALELGNLFEIHNSTGHVVIKEHGMMMSGGRVVYSVDHAITVHYRLTTWQTSENPSFFSILISPVPHAPSKRKDTCNVARVQPSMVEWSNLNWTHGYAPDSDCRLQLEVRRRQQLFYHFSVRHLENTVDDVLIRTDHVPWQVLPSSASKVQTTILHSAEAQVELAFRSDGVTQFPGFHMLIFPIECECADSKLLVSCVGVVSFGMLRNFFPYFCAGMNCSFSIELEAGCDAVWLQMDVVHTMESFFTASFAVSADGHDFIDSERDQRLMSGVQGVLMDPRANLRLRFASVVPSMDAMCAVADSFAVTLQAVQPPVMKNFTLTAEHDMFLFDFESTTSDVFFHVRLDEELRARGNSIDVLFLYGNNFSTFNVYNFDNCSFYFTEQIMVVENPAVAKLHINGSQFGLQRWKNPILGAGGLFVYATRAFKENCVLSSFHGNPFSGSVGVAVAGPEGPCRLPFVPLTVNGITSLWTNAHASSGLVTARDLWRPSVDLFQIDSSLHSDWRVPFVAATVIIFKVPANTSFSFVAQRTSATVPLAARPRSSYISIHTPTVAVSPVFDATALIVTVTVENMFGCGVDLVFGGANAVRTLNVGESITMTNTMFYFSVSSNSSGTVGIWLSTGVPERL